MTTQFPRLHLLVEGQTEEIVVRNTLAPYLEARGWSVTHSVLTTKRSAGGPHHHGGISNWAKIERDIRLLLRDSSLDVLTTLFDFYAFAPDAPGIYDTTGAGTPQDRVCQVEQALMAVVADPRFLSHLVLHELEAWVFAAAEQLLELLPELSGKLLADAAAAGGPELVNDGPHTAPSKRILGYCPQYSKTNDGPLAIHELGFDDLRAQCSHVDNWLRTLDNRKP
jgi:Domain of unknown function (DUF4276)